MFVYWLNVHSRLQMHSYSVGIQLFGFMIVCLVMWLPPLRALNLTLGPVEHIVLHLSISISNVESNRKVCTETDTGSIAHTSQPSS